VANVFEGRLVRLRAVEAADWERFYASNQDTDSARLTHYIRFPSSREQVRAWTEGLATGGAQDDVFRFKIERLDGEYVGTLNTHSADRRSGTFRYGLAILPEQRRKGFASEAIWLVLRYFFWELRYQKVNAVVYAFNEPSIRLHERLGFVLEGRLRRMIYTAGQHHDALIYGMTREEFEASGWDGLARGSLS